LDKKYFCCFWINFTQINFENIKRTIQSINFDSCFYLKSYFDARAPSLPLLNFPFKLGTQFNIMNLLVQDGTNIFFFMKIIFLTKPCNILPKFTIMTNYIMSTVNMSATVEISVQFLYMHDRLVWHSSPNKIVLYCT